jgi:hypothetical protein
VFTNYKRKWDTFKSRFSFSPLRKAYLFSGFSFKLWLFFLLNYKRKRWSFTGIKHDLPAISPENDGSYCQNQEINQVSQISTWLTNPWDKFGFHQWRYLWEMIEKPLITLLKVGLLSSLITIKVGAPRFWKAFSGYQQNVDLDRATSRVILSRGLHSCF